MRLLGSETRLTRSSLIRADLVLLRKIPTGELPLLIFLLLFTIY